MAVLQFDEATHVYTLDGIKVPSVTEITGLLSPIDANNPIIQQASRRGSLVHEYCEQIDYGAPPDEVEPELIGYLKAYQCFLRDYRPEWLNIEDLLCSKFHGFAGRRDRLGIIDKRLTQVDIKTTASFDRIAKIKLACQLAGYAIADNEYNPPRIMQNFGVQLKQDGTYTIHNTKNIEQKYGFDARHTFLQLLSLTKLTGGYTWQKN